MIVPIHESFGESIMSPRQQWKQHSEIEKLTCKEDLVLLQKNNGVPACVSPTAYLKLVDRGYGTFDIKIMKNRPSMMNNLMEGMVSNSSIMHHWHEMMERDPTKFETTMKNWIPKMKDNTQLLKNVMGPITSIPELREQMITHMKEHPVMEQSLKNHYDWMESVHEPIMSHGMGQNMNQGMHEEMCQWCPELSHHMKPHHNMGFANSDRMMDIIHHMWIQEEMVFEMHEFMLQSPNHMTEMSEQMMGPMLEFMMDDPDIREQMIDLMLQHEDFMNSIRHSNSK